MAVHGKKEQVQSSQTIGGLSQQLSQLLDIFEEELKDTKHYQKILARINRVLNRQANEKSAAEGDLKESAKAFVGLNKS